MAIISEVVSIPLNQRTIERLSAVKSLVLFATRLSILYFSFFDFPQSHSVCTTFWGKLCSFQSSSEHFCHLTCDL